MTARASLLVAVALASCGPASTATPPAGPAGDTPSPAAGTSESHAEARAPSAETAAKNALHAQIDTLFAAYDNDQVPGCALGVITDGALVHERGYGMASLEHGVANSSRAVYRIGSTSKQITAATMALLAEKGVLSLDDQVRKHVPELPDYGARMTIRHLLHHTSGLRDYLGLMSLAGHGPHDHFEDSDVLAMIVRQKTLTAPPGQEYAYSNSGYFLLSQIILRATGKSLAEQAHELIFKPLGMSNSHFRDDHTRVTRNRASGYAPQPGGGFAISMTSLPMIGDGGVLTTIEDLLRWDRNFYDNKLGKGGPALIETLLTPGVLASGKTLRYALGVNVDTYRGQRRVMHGGAFVGFRAEMVRFPEARTSVIVLCNRADANPTSLAMKVADVLLFASSEANEKSPAEPAKSKDAPARATVALSAEELARWQGSYHNVDWGIAEVAVQGDELRCQLAGRDFVLQPLSKTRFRAVGGRQEIDVEFAGNGDGRTMVTRGRSWEQRFAAIPSSPPRAKDLAGVPGEYYSEELDVTYRVVPDGNTLKIVAANVADGPMRPLARDRYSLANLLIEIVRDRRGKPVGFDLEASRVGAIRFTRN